MAAYQEVPLTSWEKECRPMKVCVTGATGYMSSSIVERLLRAGHTVHATVRNSLSDICKPLLELPGAAERLRLFEADLLREGSFDAAMAGCAAAIHTATPAMLSAPKGKAREMIIDPAIKGLQNVLNAVNRTPTVTRVVLTSSMGAVTVGPNDHPDGPAHVYTEDDWCKRDDEVLSPYNFAKKAQEQLAWCAVGEQDRWSLVTICPVMILGPAPTNRADSQVVSVFRDLIEGKFWPFAPKFPINICDVRCVAAAHCIALVHRKCQGRYLVSDPGPSTLMTDWGRWIRTEFPACWVPRAIAPKWLMWLIGPLVGIPRALLDVIWGDEVRIDPSKLFRDMGAQQWWIPPQVSLVDHVRWLINMGRAKYRGVPPRPARPHES